MSSKPACMAEWNRARSALSQSGADLPELAYKILVGEAQEFQQPETAPCFPRSGPSAQKQLKQNVVNWLIAVEAAAQRNWTIAKPEVSGRWGAVSVHAPLQRLRLVGLGRDDQDDHGDFR
jgi:hypothetical protein